MKKLLVVVGLLMIFGGCTGPAANTFGNVIDNANEVITKPDDQLWESKEVEPTPVPTPRYERVY